MIVNLTPHTVVIVDGPTIPPSGTVARIAVSRTPVDGYPVPVARPTFGDVTDLPAPDGTLYIVSAMVRLACPDRRDLLSPADLVRDDSGRVVGCRGFDVN